MKYNKDYSGKTADEWFAEKRWTGFLMRIPYDRTIVKECASVREVLAIRATASALSANNSSINRRFKITTEPSNEKMICVTATRK